MNFGQKYHIARQARARRLSDRYWMQTKWQLAVILSIPNEWHNKVAFRTKTLKNSVFPLFLIDILF